MTYQGPFVQPEVTPRAKMKAVESFDQSCQENLGEEVPYRAPVPSIPKTV